MPSKVYSIGTLVASRDPALYPKQEADIGVICDVMTNKKRKYYILWQKDKEVSGPYGNQDIEVFLQYYKEWVENVQNQ